MKKPAHCQSCGKPFAVPEMLPAQALRDLYKKGDCLCPMCGLEAELRKPK